MVVMFRVCQQRFFEDRRETMKGRAALTLSRAKYLLASKPPTSRSATHTGNSP